MFSIQPVSARLACLILVGFAIHSANIARAQDASQDVKVQVFWASWGQVGNPKQVDVTHIVDKQLKSDGVIKIDPKAFNAISGDPAPGKTKMLVCTFQYGDRTLRAGLMESVLITKPGAPTFPVVGNDEWNADEIKRQKEFIEDDFKGTGIVWARWGNYGRAGGWGEAFAPIDKQVKKSKFVKNHQRNLGVATPSKSRNKMLRVLISIDGNPLVARLRHRSYVVIEPTARQLERPATLAAKSKPDSGKADSKSGKPEMKPADPKPRPRPQPKQQPKPKPKPKPETKTKPKPKPDTTAANPKTDTASTIVQLPGKVTKMRSGAGGRLLILHIPEKGILAVFDLLQKKIVKELSVPEDVAFAANRNDLFVSVPRIRQLQKWNLTTFQRDQAVELTPDQVHTHGVVGSSGDGPLMLLTKKKVEFWDTKQLKRLEYGNVKEFAIQPRYKPKVSVSADGSTFLGLPNINISASYILRFDGNAVEIMNSAPSRQKAFPNFDGSSFLAYAGIFSYRGQPIPAKEFNNTALFSCDDPRYILAVRSTGKGAIDVTICSANDYRKIHTTKFDSILDRYARNWDRIGIEPIVRYLPQENLLACIPHTRDRIVIREFNLERILQSSGEKYLHVNSKPPATVKIGDTFSYQLTSLSNSPKVSYSLDSGPEGMKITPSGKVTWPVDNRPKQANANVVVAAKSGDGQTAIHAFQVAVRSDKGILLADESAAPPNPRGKQKADAIIGENLKRRVPVTPAKVVTLPSKFKSFCWGGSGNFLILHIPEQKSVSILDVRTAEVVKEIDVADDVVYAASRDHLVIGSKQSDQLQRWNLKSMRRDKTARIPRDSKLSLAAMGSHSDGPLALWVNDELQLWDLKEMKPGGGKAANWMSAVRGKPYLLTASPDGKTFCGWMPQNGQHFQVLRIRADGTTRFAMTPDAHSTVNFWAAPASAGDLIVRYGARGYDHNLHPVNIAPGQGVNITPSGDPRMFFGFSQYGRSKSRLTIYTAAEFKPVYVLKDHDVVDTMGYGVYRNQTNFGFRLHYAAADKLLIGLPPGEDRVIIQPFDLERALVDSGESFFFVHSAPPAKAYVGEPFTHQLSASSTNGNVSFQLISGPQGMTVSKDGQLNWPVDKRPLGGSVDVEVQAIDAAGQKTSDAFSIVVERKLAPSIASHLVGTPNKGKWFTNDPGDAGFVSFDRLRFELPERVHSISEGIDGKTILLAGQFIAILDQAGSKFEKIGWLDRRYEKIHERKGYFVAVTRKPAIAAIIDKKTLRVQRSLKLPFREITDIAAHPSTSISYIAGRRHSEIPRNRIVVFSESSAKAKESGEWIGNWIGVDPSGKFLLSSYTDHYRSGSRLLLNPDRWHVVPEYGAIDWLIRYQLDAKGEPEVSQVRPDVEHGSQKVVISNDGRRFVSRSKIWSLTDLKTVPIEIDLGGPQIKEIAWHPGVPIVAACGYEKVRVFNAGSGQHLPRKLDEKAIELSGLETRNLKFSGDGRKLLFTTANNGVEYLCMLPVGVTAAEIRAAENALKKKTTMRTKSVEPKSKPVVSLSSLQTFKGGIGKKLSTAEIARNSTASIAIVQSGDSAGTAFVVGADGYVITCAHCIKDESSIKLRFKQANKKVYETKAKLIARDDEDDLALLKTERVRKFKPLRLAVGHETEMGAQVSVIGHPGDGGLSLDYTMTQGIISSPSRNLDGKTFIQSSAAINSGNSGGPMFDDKGYVIGAVVLKANRIDSAGFAIPADTIAAFLLKNVRKTKGSLKLVREWYNHEGKGPVEAELVSYKNNEVTLLNTSDQKEFTLKIDELSAADKTYVRLFSKLVGNPKK